MLFYWLLFLVPSFLALVSSSRPQLASGFQSASLNPMWWILIICLTLVVGFRHEVGGDWMNYIYQLETIKVRPTEASFTISSDIGYNLLSLASLNLGWGIYGVNLFCGFIFSFGLGLFCRNLPRPMLALAVSIPYLVIVVGMGYSRQAVALGIALIGLAALIRQKRLRFIIFILIATTFHKSAFLLLPIAALASTKNRFLIYGSFATLSLFVYYLFLSSEFEKLITNYIESQYASEGAFIRLLMNVIPALVLLLWPHRFRFNSLEKPLWTIFAYVSILLFILLFVTNASTALDRIGLYMLPLQLVIFSYLPEIFRKSGAINQWIVIGIILYYMTVLFTWLNYASHSSLWLPYRNFIFIE